MSLRVGIIGYPIRHSISPIFQQAALDHCGLDATYQAWEVEPGSLADFIVNLRSRDTLGCNVTVPHKEAVMAHLDHVDAWAQEAGAVNTVVHRDDALRGYNTDGVGFMRALEDRGGFVSEGKRTLVIGAGGSAKAVALSLARGKVASITVANRTLDRARRLAGLVTDQGVQSKAIDMEPGPVLAEAVSDSDLVVNCTTLGMRHGLAEESSPIPGEYISPASLVYDLVYNPPETPLLREASRAGARVLGGLAMLVYQGAASFELWTGKEAPLDVMMRAGEAAL